MAQVQNISRKHAAYLALKGLDKIKVNARARVLAIKNALKRSAK